MSRMKGPNGLILVLWSIGGLMVSGSHFHSPSDAYHQAMVSLASSQATCLTGSPGCSGDCTNNPAGSYYSEQQVDDDRLVLANGLPNHSYESDAASPNPNKACEQRVALRLPLSPSLGSYRESAMGPVGISVTGGFIFNHLSSPAGDLAVPNEGPSLDSCRGHSEPTCRYHYHDINSASACHPSVPTGLNVTVSSQAAASCSLVGWMLDGFPLVTCTDSSGQHVLHSCYTGSGSSASGYSWAASTSCHLDEANGRQFASSYAYVVTDTFPWLPPGFMGAQTADICYLDGSASAGGAVAGAMAGAMGSAPSGSGLTSGGPSGGGPSGGGPSGGGPSGGGPSGGGRPGARPQGGNGQGPAPGGRPPPPQGK